MTALLPTVCPDTVMSAANTAVLIELLVGAVDSGGRATNLILGGAVDHSPINGHCWGAPWGLDHPQWSGQCWGVHWGL